jgi:hypothetical protein
VNARRIKEGGYHVGRKVVLETIGAPFPSVSFGQAIKGLLRFHVALSGGFRIPDNGGALEVRHHGKKSGATQALHNLGPSS